MRLNPDLSKPFFDWYADSSSKFSGMVRTVALINKSTKIINELGSSPIIKNLQQGAGATLGTFGVVRLPGATQNAYKSFQDLSVEGGRNSFKKNMKAFKAILSGLKCWASVFYLFSANPSSRLMLKVSSLGKEVSDFSMAVSDYSRASELSAFAVGSIKEALDYSRTYYLLRLSKNVTVIVNGILAVTSFVFSFTFLPVLVMVTISLATTMLAIHLDYLKDTGKYKVIKFF